MKQEMNEMMEESPVDPVETPLTEIATMINEGDIDVDLARREKIAELAPRFKAATESILATQTYPQDWHKFGEGDDATACLKSAGAERVARPFNIQFFEVVPPRKEEFTDALGKGYRYICEGKASLGSRIVFSTGICSSRNKFFGYKNGEYKALEDISEVNIRAASYHTFCGNAIKMLLGLRGLPWSEYERIMSKTGQDAKKTSSHRYGQGTQGGTSSDDSSKQKELAEICIAIANAGFNVARSAEGKLELVEFDPDVADIVDQGEVGKANCLMISSFIGKEGKVVSGLLASKLKGQRLSISLKTAQELAGHLKGEE